MFCIEYAIMIRLMPIVVLHADSCRRESSERIDRLSEGDRDPCAIEIHQTTGQGVR